MSKILEVNELKVNFYTDGGVLSGVDNLSFDLEKGEILAIVGESGSGKSVTSLSLLQIIPSPPGKIVGGEILYQGNDLLKLSEKQMRKVRGKEISMIFQEPMTSLNPVFTIGKMISESLILHQKISKKEAKEKTIKMLELVKIPTPERIFNEYPHQLSGGMRQRVMIALALSCDPKILIADEPTTALDVTIQAQILKLIHDLNKELQMSIILITHDLGIVAEVANRVMVMYAGQAVEYANVKQIFKKPMHPYTEGLIKSIPVIGSKVDELYSIPGTVPNPLHYGKGCRFADRCSYKTDSCEKDMPPIYKLNDGRRSRCFLRKEEALNE